MKRRCRNKARKKYPNYGGRGIGFSPRWEDFSAFLEDMGERPPNTTLGRLDNNGHYYKENCAWQTVQEQNTNKGGYKNNTSGLKGVSFDSTHSKWAAHTSGGKGKQRLYFGLDFFEACCARLSWENDNV